MCVSPPQVMHGNPPAGIVHTQLAGRVLQAVIPYTTGSSDQPMDGGVMKEVQYRRFVYTGMLALFILGVSASLWILLHSAWHWYPEFRNAMNIDRLVQIEVPGSADLNLDHRGAYAVYYEYRSVVNGRVYDSAQSPPPLICTLNQRGSGDSVTLVPDYVSTHRYNNGSRAGVLLYSATIPAAGRYQFNCSYPDGSQSPVVVLSIGQNIFREIALVVWEAVQSSIEKGGVLLGLTVLAAVSGAGTVWAINRRETAKTQELKGD